MRAFIIVAGLLIAGGLFILIKSPSFSSEKSVLKVGTLEAKVNEEHEIPGWVGGAAIAAGVVLLGFSFRK